MTFSPGDYRNQLLIAAGDSRGELLLRGWSFSDPIERANLTRPQLVRDAAEAFLDAGADVLVTITHGANAVALAQGSESGHPGEVDVGEINRRGAELFRAAVSDYPAGGRYVLGGIGPVEQLLMLDEIEEQALYDAYAAQAKALASGGVDGILCQSFTELDSLLVAVRAAIATTNLPVIGAMTFDSGAERTETALGVTAPQACEALMDAGAAGVGCDGGESPDGVAGAVALVRASGESPIWASISPGLPELMDGEVVYPESPEDFASRLPVLVDAGASFVGGGRGTSVEHIAALAQAKRRLFES
ncbi:MAG: homocysteine S-methyltransferase family protein [Planctomycetota bacterium]